MFMHFEKLIFFLIELEVLCEIGKLGNFFFLKIE